MKSLLSRPFFLIIIVGFLLYFPSLFGKFVWDDEDFVFANRYVQRFEIANFFTQSITSGRSKGSNYFRPVQGTLYSTTFQAVGPNPFWFHLLNVLVHIGATSAIFIFFKKILPEKSTIIPLLISLLFLIHPVQTEAVSYISGLSDPLFVLFGFLALIFFLLRHERKNMVPLSVGFFILSLLSKETGLVFLPIVLVFTYLITDKKHLLESVTNTLRESLPFLISAIIYLGYHYTFINSFDVKASWGNNLYANSVVVRLLTFIQSLFSYVGLIIFPKNLFMERDYWVQIQTNILNPYLIIFVVFNLLLVGSLFFLYKKLKIPKDKITALIFCYLAFFISFVPYSGVVLINGIFYEHFLYLPLVFFFAFWLIFFWPLINRFPKISSLIIGIFFLGLVVRNISRQFDWIDPVKFYSQTLSHAPKSIRIINGLGIAYSEQGDLKKAIEVYHQGIILGPKTPNFYHNIANNYASLKNFDEAERYYLKAIEVDPNFSFSWQSLAGLYAQTGQKEKLSALAEKLKNRFKN